ncbi:uncharacterized protein LOC143764883 isoform X1 [Ranitomeya variabilis]|uniref:uncharacterized protein LOC143764883 isoform X1 n=1 Tax=Ranitomeya variabilis TaxID=490064 RepID=UPI0040573B65
MSLCLNLTRNFSLWCPNQNVSGVPENTPAFHQVFLRSKPRFRGIAQIVLAIFQLAFGIVLNFFGGKIYTLYSYIIFWGPPFLIISGVLAVVAHRVASSKLVRVCYIFHTISILISLTGLVLACIDAFNIYPCGATCGNLPAMTVTGFGAMASMLQLSISVYIVYYGFNSLKYILEHPPQPPANENLGFVLPDPPAYFEATFHEPPPFLQPSPFLQPPPYPQFSTTSAPPAFCEVADHLQPPPYSE